MNFKAEFSASNVAAVNAGELSSASDKPSSSQCVSSVGMLLRCRESAAKTDGWQSSIVSTIDREWVQP